MGHEDSDHADEKKDQDGLQPLKGCGDDFV
jgi:hypothetical protein